VQQRLQKLWVIHLVKDEKEGIFSANLYPANKKDKELFGCQNFLNCKSLEQYKNCYINFLLKEAKTDNEIKGELKLIKNFRMIFSRGATDLSKKENEFKESIIEEVLKVCDKEKGNKIIKAWKELSVFNSKIKNNIGEC